VWLEGFLNALSFSNILWLLLGTLIGLIIGDFFMAGSWAIYGLFSYASYMVLPD